jgi:hypothetical protein
LAQGVVREYSHQRVGRQCSRGTPTNQAVGVIDIDNGDARVELCLELLADRRGNVCVERRKEQTFVRMATPVDVSCQGTGDPIESAANSERPGESGRGCRGVDPWSPYRAEYVLHLFRVREASRTWFRTNESCQQPRIPTGTNRFHGNRSANEEKSDLFTDHHGVAWLPTFCVLEQGASEVVLFPEPRSPNG